MRQARPENASLTEYWNVTYNLRDTRSGDACRNVEMSWENRTPAQIMENLNAFLVAANVPLKVVAVK